MSVQVSKITNGSTGAEVLWGHDPHAHFIGYETYTVPSMDDLREVDSSCRDTSEAIKELERKFGKLGKKVEDDKKELQSLISNELSAYNSKYNDLQKVFQKELAPGSKFFTAFEGMTKEHIKNVQAVLDNIQKISKENSGKFDTFNKEAQLVKEAIKKCYEDNAKSIVSVKTEGTQIVSKLDTLSEQLALQMDAVNKKMGEVITLGNSIQQKHDTQKAELQRLGAEIVEQHKKTLAHSIETLKTQSGQITSQWGALAECITGQMNAAQKVTDESNNAAIGIRQQHNTLKGELKQLGIEIAERRKHLATLQEQHERILATSEDMLAVCAVFNHTRSSFMRRLKWLFTGKTTPIPNTKKET